MIGQTISHYRILAKIGAGGMGEVYRAHDEQLDRDVALKLLHAQTSTDDAARARLLREARAAASLNHPHICTIHEVGEADDQAYIAMELVEGRPLSMLIPAGGLAVETVLRYGAQVADALAHAHERGIVHRDLKSLNIVITPEGRAKVLDFGLAKRVKGEELDEATGSQLSLTETGAVVGTLAYLSPERLRGHPADARSDIWALGCVLHEMATGERPFRGSSGFEVTSAILRDKARPLPPGVAPGLAAAIEKCLAKEPGQRYQHAGEVRAALEAVSARPMSADSATEAIEPLRTSRLFKRIAAAGAALLTLVVAFLLAREAGWWMPSSQKPTTESELHLGADVDPVAFELYQRGKSLEGYTDSRRRACELYQQASEKDPDFASAFGAYAICLITVANHGVEDPKEAFPRARDAALRARELDPTGVETLKAMFAVNMSVLRDYHGAETVGRQLRERDPNDPRGYRILGELFSLMGRHEEAVAAARKAVELNPQSYDPNLHFGRILYYARRYPEAIAQLTRAIELDPNSSFSYFCLADCYDMLGQHDAALAPLQKGGTLIGDPLDVVTELARAFARGGIRARLQAEAAYYEHPPGDGRPLHGPAALAYAALGDKDKAFHWLDVSYQEYDSIIFRIQDPVFDSLHDDQRWKDLLIRLHLHDTPLADVPAAPPVVLR